MDPIAQLLRGVWPDPDGGPPLGVPIDAIVIEPSLRGNESELVASLNFGARIAVVSDPATREALGLRVERALRNATSIVLEPHPHADSETVERVRAAAADCDALIAVGSGTINDLCKYAAALERKPYAVFATAPSMNGYTSGNAAITVHGHKKTLPAVTPRGVFVDLGVLAAAPARLIRAGIGDSICRPTAQSDWLLSHLVRGTPYRRAPFDLLADDEPVWLDAPEAIVAGEADALRALVRTLLLSGIGMTLCGGSYPASQGEHLVSHYIDMFAPPDRSLYLHGEQVAVATLAMAALQERLLSSDTAPLPATAASPDALTARFGGELGASCWSEYERKQLSQDELRRLTEDWSAIRDAIRKIAVPAARVADVLRRAGAPTTAADIGVPPEFFAKAFSEARFLRDRFTFLDLAPS